MVKSKRLILLIISLILIMSVAGCSKSASTPTTPTPVTLTVSAAASLKTAMDEIKVKKIGPGRTQNRSGRAICCRSVQ